MKFLKKIFFKIINPFIFIWLFITKFSFTWSLTKIWIKSKYIKLILKIKLFFLWIRARIRYKKITFSHRMILFFRDSQWVVVIVFYISIYLFLSFGDLAINLDHDELRKVLILQEWDQTTIVKGHRSQPHIILPHIFSYGIVLATIPILYIFSESIEGTLIRNGGLLSLALILHSMEEYEYFWEVFLAYIQWAVYPVAIFVGLVFYFFPHGIEWEDDDEEEEEDDDEEWMELWWDPVGELETAVFVEYVKQGRETQVINFADSINYASEYLWSENEEREGEEELYWLVGKLTEADRIRQEGKTASCDTATAEIKEKYSFLLKNESEEFGNEFFDDSDDENNVIDTENYEEYEEPYVYKRGVESSDFADSVYDTQDQRQYQTDDFDLMLTHFKQFNHIHDVFLNPEEPGMYEGPKTAEEIARDEEAAQKAMFDWDDDWFVKDEETPVLKESENKFVSMMDPKRWSKTRIRFSHNDERFLNTLFPFNHEGLKLFYSFSSKIPLNTFFKKREIHIETKIPNFEIIKSKYNYSNATELQKSLIDIIKQKQTTRGIYQLELAISTFIGKHPRISKYLFLNSLVSMYEKLKYNIKSDLILPKNKNKIKNYKFSVRDLEYKEHKIKYFFRKPLLWYKKYKVWKLRRTTKALEQQVLKVENRWQKIKDKKVSKWKTFRYRIFLFFQGIWKDGLLREENSNYIFHFLFGRKVKLFLIDVASARNVINTIFAVFWIILSFLWESLFLVKVQRIWIVGPYSVYCPQHKYHKSLFLNSRFEFYPGNFFIYYRKIIKNDNKELSWKKLELKFWNKIHKVKNKRFFVKISKKKL